MFPLSPLLFPSLTLLSQFRSVFALDPFMVLITRDKITAFEVCPPPLPNYHLPSTIPLYTTFVHIFSDVSDISMEIISLSPHLSGVATCKIAPIRDLHSHYAFFHVRGLLNQVLQPLPPRPWVRPFILIVLSQSPPVLVASFCASLL
jgi:hypothetical protein